MVCKLALGCVLGTRERLMGCMLNLGLLHPHVSLWLCTYFTVCRKVELSVLCLQVLQRRVFILHVRFCIDTQKSAMLEKLSYVCVTCAHSQGETRAQKTDEDAAD